MRARLKPWLYCLLLIPFSVAADDVSFEKLWDLQTGSAIYGGVNFDEEHVYAGNEDGVVHVIDKASGKTAWTYDAGAGISSKVAVDGPRVYFHSRDGAVHALNKTDGAPVWKFSTQGERQWDYWDYYLSTPAVDDRQIYFGSGDHNIYALNKRTGDLRWKVKTGGIMHGQPVLSGEKVIAGGFDGRVYAVDRGTGRVLWKFKTVGNAYFRNGEIPGAVAVGNGLVFVGGRDYNIYALLEETGTGAWNDKTPSWVVGQPLVIDEELVVVNSDGSMVFSYDAKSGKINWEFKNSYNMFAGARILGTSYVAVAGLDGRITVLAREDGAVAGYYETDGSRTARDEYFNDDGSLDYTGIRSLEDLMGLYDRQMAAMAGIPGDIAVEGNVIYYGAASGEVAAIRVNGID